MYKKQDERRAKVKANTKKAQDARMQRSAAAVNDKATGPAPASAPAPAKAKATRKKKEAVTPALNFGTTKRRKKR